MAGPFKEGEGLERPVAGREAELSSEAGPLFAEQPSVWRWVLVEPDGLRAGWGLLLWVVIYFLALNIRQAVVDGFHGLRHDAVVTAVDARAAGNAGEHSGGGRAGGAVGREWVHFNPQSFYDCEGSCFVEQSQWLFANGVVRIRTQARPDPGPKVRASYSG